MELIFLGIVALTIITAVAGFRGQRQNRALAVQIGQILEASFDPIAKEYRNIGGVVGYHLNYDLAPPFKKLQGTLTFLPRHTILYLPISRSLGRRDALHLTVYMEAMPAGEGHLVDAATFRRGWIPIEHVEEMDRVTEVFPGREFVILSYNRLLQDRMKEFAGRLADVPGLRHVGCYGYSNCYAVLLEPDPATLLSSLTRIQTLLRETYSAQF